MGLVTVTAPTTYPLARDEAKAYARIDGTADDALVDDLIAFATAFVERETGQQIITATKRLTLDRFPQGHPWTETIDGQARLVYAPPLREIRIPTPPLQSVTSVQYVSPIDGTLQTMDPADYTVDADGMPGRVVLNQGKAWPTAQIVANAVRITFACGHGDATATPKLFKQAVRRAFGHAWENREATSELSLNELPLGLQSVIESLMFRQAVERDAMQAGQLRHRVNVECAVYAVGSSGERKPTWGVWQTLSARVEPVSGRLATFAKTIGATVSHRITLRWFPGLLTTDRVTFGDRVFTINAALNVEERGRQLDLYCTEVVDKSQPAAATVGYDTLGEATYDALEE